MQALREVIDQAAANVGSNKALAEQLGVSPQRLNDWKAGNRPCPIHAQAQIAEAAGLDAREWVWRAVCRQLGRSVVAVVLTVAATFAAFAPGADGDLRLAR